MRNSLYRSYFIVCCIQGGTMVAGAKIESRLLARLLQNNDNDRGYKSRIEAGCCELSLDSI